LYDIIEEAVEEDGKGETNTTIMRDWNSVVGDKYTKTFLDYRDWEREIRKVNAP
jgi:hypothetical protein